MPTIVVDVMPKPELLDPQGKAVSGAFARLGVEGFTDVRIGGLAVLPVDPVVLAVLDAGDTGPAERRVLLLGEHPSDAECTGSRRVHGFCA
nr:phosphoribosylformylglycinamidine synthase subunit PurS [Microbacterium barkeri]